LSVCGHAFGLGAPLGRVPVDLFLFDRILGGRLFRMLGWSILLWVRAKAGKFVFGDRAPATGGELVKGELADADPDELANAIS